MKSKWLRRLERSSIEGLAVRVRRNAGGDLHGFVLGLSEELVLLSVLQDFHPDGCIALRTKDIEKVRSGECEREMERLVEAEGLTEALRISTVPPLDDMKTLLTHVQEAGLPVIVEESRVLFGYVTRVDGKRCWVHHFDALGRWDEKPTRAKIKRVETVQLGSPYVAVWLRHIAACPSLPDGHEQ